MFKSFQYGGGENAILMVGLEGLPNVDVVLSLSQWLLSSVECEGGWAIVYCPVEKLGGGLASRAKGVVEWLRKAATGFIAELDVEWVEDEDVEEFGCKVVVFRGSRSRLAEILYRLWTSLHLLVAHPLEGECVPDELTLYETVEAYLRAVTQIIVEALEKGPLFKYIDTLMHSASNIGAALGLVDHKVEEALLIPHLQALFVESLVRGRAVV